MDADSLTLDDALRIFGIEYVPLAYFGFTMLWGWAYNGPRP